MKLEKPHSFSQEEAVARIKALTTYWDTRYGTRTTWTDNRAHIKGKVKGISFEGKFSIDDRCLLADVKVGFLAEKIGGKAYVVRKLDDYLRETNTLQALQARI
jgi:Putative polyhydroxyalkanoic acid system protein (PHA_gran_rgn)